ncbi:hypothetical protein AB6A40_008880 [Gnathostoma spinigerum]|uniref:Uncharacterized protein n=1 Tax=Gnathostoma spinigerum TaxID=75299 RepID=A0ABD6ES71_9BILA
MWRAVAFSILFLIDECQCSSRFTRNEPTPPAYFYTYLAVIFSSLTIMVAYPTIVLQRQRMEEKADVRKENEVWVPNFPVKKWHLDDEVLDDADLVMMEEKNRV